MKKLFLVLLLFTFLFFSCATGFVYKMDGYTPENKSIEKIGEIVKTQQYWSPLFLYSVKSMRSHLSKRALKEAKDIYGQDIELINLSFSSEWNGLSLLFYFSMMGSVQDVTLTADVIKYVNKAEQKIKENETHKENTTKQSTQALSTRSTNFVQTKYGKLIIHNSSIYKDYWEFIIEYINNTDLTFMNRVTIKAIIADNEENIINFNTRSFFTFEYGDIYPGFTGTVKIPVEFDYNQKPKKFKIGIEVAQ